PPNGGKDSDSSQKVKEPLAGERDPDQDEERDRLNEEITAALDEEMDFEGDVEKGLAFSRAQEGEGDHEIIESAERFPQNLFIIPLKNFVIFPALVMPIQLGNPKALKTLKQAQSQSDYIGFLCLQHPDIDPSEPNDLFDVGTMCKVVKTLNLPDNQVNVLVQGMRRFRVKRFLRTKPYFIARVEYLDETLESGDEMIALTRTVHELATKIVTASDAFGEEFSMALANLEEPKAVADFTAAYFARDFRERQRILETDSIKDRLQLVAEVLTRELDLLELGKKIRDQLKDKIEKTQREFFLREQLKAIRQELGESLDEQTLEHEKYKKLIEESGMPEEARKKAEAELDRLMRMAMESAESAVIRNYLDWLTSLPWDKSTKDNDDIQKAEEVLERDHHGLKEVKARVLEYLAVRKLKPDHRGSIICFAGPPGTGKTSLGRSIASALGREFLRVSLGGVRDEAEIRGHRRTYIGAMPGRIIQSIKTAGSNNPVFMLDEMDKLGSDFRGDPSSSLLEALDPEQNVRFSDHYIEVPFDLSKVMFIGTANNLSTIPGPLLDRMEVIELNGYIIEEKVAIAQRYLIPRQLKEHGLAAKQLKISKGAIQKIITGFTREAGVRGLEKSIAKICRKTAARITKKKSKKESVIVSNLEKYLGRQRFQDDLRARADTPGVAPGLAWTPVGGEILFIESLRMETRGSSVQLTGKLGDVMSESAKIALTHVRSQAEKFKIDTALFENAALHIHVPAGAVPKDGPSAGITIAVSLISLLKGVRVRPGLGMTGELTLTGRILPVGGIRDKILAAKRAGLKEIILPAQNTSSVEEVPEHLQEGLTFHFVEKFAEVYKLVFPET
ncbi:MAG: endopeptidase La, partial [Planctomycetota bacterium]